MLICEHLRLHEAKAAFYTAFLYCKSSVQSTALYDRTTNSRLTTALQCYPMFDLRRYGYLVASLINRECIEISKTASSDVVCAPRATCRDETASVNSRELEGFRQAVGERSGEEAGGCWLQNPSTRLNINSVLSGYIRNAGTTWTHGRKSLGFACRWNGYLCESVAVTQKTDVKETPINIVHERETTARNAQK